MSNSLDDVLGGGGGKTAFTKQTPIGTKYSGPIVEAVTSQIRDIVTDKPKFWDDNRPQMQIVVRIQTDLRNDEDDDGIRALYIKTWGVWKTALMEAVQDGGFSKVSEALAPGNIFSDEYYGDKPAAQKGMSDTKLHRYTVAKASGGALDDAMGADPTTGELPPQQQAAQFPTGSAQGAPIAGNPGAPVVATPSAAAVAAPAANDPVTTARSLIAANLPDDVIHSTTGLDHVVIQALRNAA